MEWNVDAGQGNGGKATLEFDVALGALKLLSALEARVNNLAQHLLDLVHGEPLSQLKGVDQLDVISIGGRPYLLDVDLLHLEIVEDVCHGLQSDQFTSANILLTLHTRVKTCTAVTANKNLPRH